MRLDFTLNHMLVNEDCLQTVTWPNVLRIRMSWPIFCSMEKLLLDTNSLPAAVRRPAAAWTQAVCLGWQQIVRWSCRAFPTALRIRGRRRAFLQSAPDTDMLQVVLVRQRQHKLK